MATETRRFSMNEKLLFDVIRRQAGTLAKAILEGVMNSIEARSRDVHIHLDATTLRIADAGRGFRSRTEITTFFEVFGQPHTEAEGKIYANFRMGRGQLFAYGVNRWKSGLFRMDVDIKGRGLDYELTTDVRRQLGCVVEVKLYDPLLPSELAETVALISRWVKWAPVPVWINGRKVSLDVAEQPWTHVLDEAYVLLDDSAMLSVYNLGIHTQDLSKYRLGTGGVVVSRRQLKLNFARNDIQSDCPVWKQVARVVDQQATEINLRSRSLDDAGRQRVADQMSLGALAVPAAMTQRVFTAVNGRHYSLGQLMNYRELTVCRHGDRLGDKVHQQKLAFVLSGITLRRFNVTTVEELVAWIATYTGNTYWQPKCVPFATLTAGMNHDYEVLDDKELIPRERVWLALAASAGPQMSVDGWEMNPTTYTYSMDRPQLRRFTVGLSDQADGWTDGRTYVAINRKFLARLEFDVHGYTRLGQLILHEYCHDGSDTAEHTHSQEFYERYHNSEWALPAFLTSCLVELPKITQAQGRKLTKKQLKEQDRIEKGRRSLAAFAAKVFQP